MPEKSLREFAEQAQTSKVALVTETSAGVAPILRAGVPLKEIEAFASNDLYTRHTSTVHQSRRSFADLVLSEGTEIELLLKKKSTFSEITTFLFNNIGYAETIIDRAGEIAEKMASTGKNFAESTKIIIPELNEKTFTLHQSSEVTFKFPTSPTHAAKSNIPQPGGHTAHAAQNLMRS